MNWVDGLLALLFIVGLTGGYIQGFLRQLMSLGAIVCALILATYLRMPLAAWLAFTFADTAPLTRQIVAFLVPVLLITTALELIQRRGFPESRLLGLGILDRIAGIMAAFPTVCLQMSVVALIVRFLARLSWPIGNTLRLVLLRGIESSTLLPVFYNLLVYLVTTIGGLLPEAGIRFLTPI